MYTETILISGATSGIGLATARLLAKQGRNLIITGRRKEILLSVASELIEKGAKVYAAQLDVRNKIEVESFFEQLPAEFQKIRVLINNAGLAAGMDFIQSGDTNDWDQMIDTNVKGLLYMTRAAIQYLENTEGAQIVNIGSIAGREVYPKGNVYCATKHAVDALTRAMRIDLHDKGIRVSSVNPGLVETEFSLVRFKGDTEKANAVYKGLEPLIGDDIAETIRYIIESPFRISIADLTIFASAQASSRDLIRNN
jgi:3-hydroxy acid dehydrogenase/malonic semialdehyde reductase